MIAAGVAIDRFVGKKFTKCHQVGAGNEGHLLGFWLPSWDFGVGLFGVIACHVGRVGVKPIVRVVVTGGG